MDCSHILSPTNTELMNCVQEPVCVDTEYHMHKVGVEDSTGLGHQMFRSTSEDITSTNDYVFSGISSSCEKTKTHT